MDDKPGMVKVVEGEASESDEENEEEEIVREDDKMTQETPPTASEPGPQSKPEAGVNPGNQRSPVTAPEVSRRVSEQKLSGGLLVSGEASESEEEGEGNKVPYVGLMSTALLLHQPLKVEMSSPVATYSSVITSPPLSSQPSTPERLLRLDSLLHKKLKETNDRLKSHIEGFKSKQLENATKDLRNISLQLSKSQAVVKEISNALRMTTNDLFHVEDKLDIIASCTLIPYINIAPVQNVKPPSSKSPAPQGSPITT